MRNSEISDLGRPMIILDKSFVRAVSKKRLREVCRDHCVLMTEDLFFEIMHGDEVERVRCFAKFPSGEGMLSLVPSVGALIRDEIISREPSALALRGRHILKVELNKDLVAGHFVFAESHLGGLQEWQNILANSALSFASCSRLVTRVFPRLRGYRPGQSRTSIDEAIADIAVNIEFVRGFYREISPANFVPADIVGPDWVTFRYVQAQLIANLEFFAMYGVDVHEPKISKLQNERADLNYLILAALANGLASQDSKLKSRFKLLRPDGILLEE